MFTTDWPIHFPARRRFAQARVQDASKKYQQKLLSSVYPDQSSAGWLGLFTENMTALNTGWWSHLDTGIAVSTVSTVSDLWYIYLELSNFLHENVAVEAEEEY